MTTSTLSLTQRRRENARKEKQEIQMRTGQREKPVKPPAGRSKWRILPSWKSEDDPSVGRAWGQHFVRDAKGDLVAVHMCYDRTYGKQCPICDALTDAIRHSDDETQKILEQAKAAGRYLLNALRLDGENPNTPVLLELSPTTYQKYMDLLDKYADPDDDDFGEGEIDLLSLETGRDIVITRTGTGLGTKYEIQVSSKSRRVDPSVMKQVQDLDDYVNQAHEESQRKALAAFGVLSTGVKAISHSSNDDDDGFDNILEGEFEEQPAKPKAKATKAAKAPAKQVEENDELDDILGELDDLDL